MLTCAPGDDNARIHWAWKQVLGRDADPAEASVLGKLLNKHRTEYAKDEKAADALVSVGISAQAKDLDKKRARCVDLRQPRAVES